MKKIIALCLLLAASFAFAQRQSVAVMKSLADEESKIKPTELTLLTQELHSIAEKRLPKEKFSLKPIDEVQKIYESKYGSKDEGAKAFNKDCEVGKCMGRIVEELSFNYGTRCDFSAVNEQLYVYCSLYGTSENALGSIGPAPIKDFKAAQDLIKKEAPAMFDNIAKSPKELCEANKDKVWDNGTCITNAQLVEQIAEKNCKDRNEKDPGKGWRRTDGVCKSEAQIACEAEIKKGAEKQWVDNKCKTNAEIKCENDGNEWDNGECITDAKIVEKICKDRNKEDPKKGWTFRNGSCKTKEQIECENTSGSTWVGEKCKTSHQINCEEKGHIWLKGDCKDPYAPPPRIDPQVGGGPISASFVTAVLLDVAGVAVLGYGIYKNNDAKNKHDDYISMHNTDKTQSEFDDAYKKADDAGTARNVSYILGSILLASGIGVHVWF